MANHDDNQIIFNNKILVIKEGQLVTGRKALAERTGIAEATCEDILNFLENEGQIQQQKNNKFRLITIINWKSYQEKQQPAIQQGIQPADTNNRDILFNSNLPLDNKGVGQNFSEADFEAFWQAYPKHIGKAKARQIFFRIKGTTMAEILAAIEDQKKTEQWQNPKYIPHPATWLNQERWQDEVKKLTPDEEMERFARECLAKDPENGWFAFQKVYGDEGGLKLSHLFF